MFWCSVCKHQTTINVMIKKDSFYETVTLPHRKSWPMEWDRRSWKLKLSRYTPRWRLGREEVQLLLFLNLGTRRGWVVSITPRPRFTPGQRAPGIHCTGGWVGPRAGLDAEARGKILWVCRGSNPGRPVTILTELPRLTADHEHCQNSYVEWRRT
jgi:hypothetical protein